MDNKKIHSKIERYCGIDLGVADKFLVNTFILKDNTSGYVDMMMSIPQKLYSLGYRTKKLEGMD